MLKKNEIKVIKNLPGGVTREDSDNAHIRGPVQKHLLTFLCPQLCFSKNFFFLEEAENQEGNKSQKGFRKAWNNVPPPSWPFFQEKLFDRRVY